jgi:hypothetical protein
MEPRSLLLFLMVEADNLMPLRPCKQLLAAAAATGEPSIEAHWDPATYHLFDRPTLPSALSPTVGSNPARAGRRDP